MSDEIELHINLISNQNLTESDINNFHKNSPVENQFKNKWWKMVDGDLIKIMHWQYFFYTSTEMWGSNYMKIPLRCSANLNSRNDDSIVFWSIIASLHPCKKSHRNRVSICKRYCDELNIQCFGFSNGFKCIDVYNSEKLNKLSKNLFELIFYRDQINWKHKLISLAVSKNDSDRVVDIFIKKKSFHSH